MKASPLRLLAVLAALAFVFATPNAHAQNGRSWISQLPSGFLKSENRQANGDGDAKSPVLVGGA